jgi:hypothetical protein
MTNGLASDKFSVPMEVTKCARKAEGGDERNVRSKEEARAFRETDIAFPISMRYSAKGGSASQECQWQGATVKLTRTHSQRLLGGWPASGTPRSRPTAQWETLYYPACGPPCLNWAFS